MRTVLCVLRQSEVYNATYVEKLFAGVSRNLPVPFKFYCLNDLYEDERSTPGINWIPLKYDWPAHWAKVEMWRPDIEERLRNILYIDLDTIVTGSLVDIFNYDGRGAITKDFYHGGPSQSVLFYRVGEMRHVWDAFMADPEGWITRPKRRHDDFHDQALMNHVPDLDWLEFWQDILPGQVVSYKVHCKQGLPPNARLVCFHGKPKCHEVQADWVRDFWR